MKAMELRHFKNRIDTNEEVDLRIIYDKVEFDNLDEVINYDGIVNDGYEID